jgi:hypothetical protein
MQQTSKLDPERTAKPSITLSDVADLVRNVISHLNCEFALGTPVGLEDKSVILGEEGPLDSMLVVMLIANLEEQIEAKFDVSVSLLEDPEMLREGGPLVRVGTLIRFLLERIAAKPA